MKRIVILCVIITCLICSATPASAVKYKKVKSFKDAGQNRAFMIALTEEVPPAQLEDALREIVNKQMEKYGQAPSDVDLFFR